MNPNDPIRASGTVDTNRAIVHAIDGDVARVILPNGSISEVPTATLPPGTQAGQQLGAQPNPFEEEAAARTAAGVPEPPRSYSDDAIFEREEQKRQEAIKAAREAPSQVEVPDGYRQFVGTLARAKPPT